MARKLAKKFVFPLDRSEAAGFATEWREEGTRVSFALPPEACTRTVGELIALG